MRKAIVCALLGALLLGCGSDHTALRTTADDALDDTLFPFTPRELQFVTSDGGRRGVSVEPGANGASATLRIRDDTGGEARMDVRRDSEAVYFSAGPGLGTALLRFGEKPGGNWPVGSKTVNFDGWDRIETPAGVFDAARITVTRGPANFQERETWWFAPGEGLVRYRKDNAGVWENEMWRSR